MSTSIEKDARQGRPSGSAFNRYARCTGSFELEKKCHNPVQINQAIAERGTLLHSTLETGDIPPGLSFDDQSFIEIAWAQVRNVLSEIDPDWQSKQPKIITEQRLWMYHKMKPLYSGQIDLQVVFSDYVVGFDYKTGWDDYQDSEINDQFKAYVPLIWDNFEEKNSLKGVYFAKIQPNKGKPSVAFWDPEQIEQLRLWAVSVIHGLESMKDIRTPGDQCKYCNAHTICPESLRYSAGALEKLGVDSLSTDEQKIAAFEILKHAEVLANKVKAMLKESLSEEGKTITSPLSGKTYALGKPKQSSVIPDSKIKEAWNKASASLNEDLILSCMNISYSQLRDKYVEHHFNLAKLGKAKVTKKALKEQFETEFSELVEISESQPSITTVK